MDADPRLRLQDASNADTRIVSVALGARGYDIVIGGGLLAQSGELIAKRLGAAKCAIITDTNVAGLHLDALLDGLGDACPQCGTITLNPGEATKSFAELAPLCERLLELGVERGDLVIAFGGGVVGDLGGFAASILRRGVRLVQIPT
ncbi:MAG: 3-dehydroquinate synthase, partial [Methyloligellaceae bacterium]